jgi:hypothetical protein
MCSIDECFTHCKTSVSNIDNNDLMKQLYSVKKNIDATLESVLCFEKLKRLIKDADRRYNDLFRIGERYVKLKALCDLRYNMYALVCLLEFYVFMIVFRLEKNTRKNIKNCKHILRIFPSLPRSSINFLRKAF